MRYRLGVDTGGTFTDFVLVDQQDWSYRTHKTPSTPDDPARSLVQGLAELAAPLGREPAELAADVALIVHGTTVATNAVLTSTGAEVALLTTEGFRDALQMRRGMREETLNNKLAAPRPLVPRRRRLGLAERVTATGEVLRPLADRDLEAAARRCREEGVAAVAVCFLHAYANPEHELRARKVLAAELPGVYVTTSHELLAQVRLYERVSTTCLNAYTGPLIDGYLARLVERLEGLGFRGELLIMQSSGGVTSPAVARERAAATLLSGPAAVPIAGAAYAGAAGAASCLTVDMGGTSFDAALVPEGAPAVLHDGGWINRHRVALPMLAIHTIGAGGGSVGWVDRGGILRMGPHSAGADPGPACYGRGGRRPTCTDANLVLGYLNPDNFLGGRIRLDRAAAEAAVAEAVGGPLGIDVPEAAAAMFDVINVNMTEGIREVSVDQGADPRDFLLVVGGGAGPVHGGVIADELSIPSVLVPRDSAVFAAVGMLLADIRHDAVRALPGRLSALDPEAVAAVVEQLVSEVLERMRAEGVADDAVAFEVACDLRYQGQFHEIVLVLPLEELRAGRLGAVPVRFDAEHERRYGWATPGAELELVNVRVAGAAARPKPVRTAPAPAADAAPDPAVRGTRRAWLPFQARFAEVPVLDGSAMAPGMRLPGPGIVELPTTTLFVPEAASLQVTAHGDFQLSVRDRSGA
jgi:N-methylhydantoinase A